MSEEKPWQRKPFWANEHSVDEKRRRAHMRLKKLRILLWRTNPNNDAEWQRRFTAVQQAEKDLGLTPTTLKRAMDATDH